MQSQTYAVAPAMKLLEMQAIQAFAKGHDFEDFCSFLAHGPYVPREILVPVEQTGYMQSLLEIHRPVSQ
jgi:hypothetical protein